MSYRPIDYEWMKLQLQPPSLTPRPWQLPPWTNMLGNTSILNTPPPLTIQPPRPPQMQLMLPDWGEWHPRRGGTRTDIVPPPQPPQFDIKTRLETQQIKNMPPGLRELYAALLGAGRYAVITPALDVLSRWIRREDPTKGLEEFQMRAEAASYASPWAHLVGQGVGLAGIAGLTAEGLIARGAGAADIERLLSGLRSSAKSAAIGAGVGAGAGAAEGVLTGRDPFAEAAKFGSIGLLTGLGGVPWSRLAAGGILGVAVGGSAAKEYGPEKGLEAGSEVFLLPIVAPERLTRGVFAGLTQRRLRTELVAEPAAAAPAQQPRVVELPTMQDVRTYMLLTRRSFSDVVADLARQSPPEARRDLFANVAEMALDRLRAGYDRDAVLAVLRNVRSKLDPAMRTQFDEVLRQYGLTDVKSATPEYSLTEESAAALNQFMKMRMPEYSLTDESARLLNQFLKTRQTQYSLTDEAAQRLNLFLRRTPEYALTDEAAALLNQLPELDPAGLTKTLSGPGAGRIQLQIRSEPEPRSYMLLKTRQETQYSLTDEAAVLLNQLFRQEPALAHRLEPRQTYVVAPAVAAAQAVAPRSATAAVPATETTTTATTETTPSTTPGQTPTTTTPPPETPPNTPPGTPPRTPPPNVPPYIPPPGTPPRTPPPNTPPGTPPRTPPPNVPPYIPPWMLNLPVYIALPLLAQMGLNLPPPPNQNMPLGTYLRMLRFPVLGRQREVFVLI